MRRSPLISIPRFLLVGLVVALGAAEGATAANAATGVPTLTGTATCDAATGIRTITWTITSPRAATVTELTPTPIIAPVSGLKVGDPIGPDPVTVTQTFPDYGTTDTGVELLLMRVKYDDGTVSSEEGGSVVFRERCGNLVRPQVTVGQQCDGLVSVDVREPAEGQPVNLSVRGQDATGAVRYQDGGSLNPDGTKQFWVPADWAQPVIAYADGYPVGSGKPGSGCAAHAVSKTISLFADNHRYVTTAGGGLHATAITPGPAEQFDLISDLPQGYIALRNKATGKYVTAVAGSKQAPAADADSIGAAQMFTPDQTSDPGQPVSYEFTRFATYVDLYPNNPAINYLEPVTDDPAAPVALSVSRPGAPFGRFGTIDVNDTNVGFKAQANGKYVTAEGAGTQPLIARGTSVGAWEQFDVIPVFNGQVALFSHADGAFVTAEAAGTAPLIARGTGIGAWEKYTVVGNPDGTVSLKANANNQYVTAENAGTQPLIARATAVGAWEEFTRGH
jgi:hypothetical protein